VSVGATLTASLLAVLARPATWPLALLGFLVRGGWLLVVAPIVVVPTPVGIANAIAPLVEDVAFGRRTGELALLVGLAVLVVIVILLGGGLVAALAEAESIREVADEEHIAWSGGPVARRILIARLAAHIPFAIALAWGSARFLIVGYREMTVPSDVSIPLVWRVLAGAPEAVALLVITWSLGEVVGALAARRIVLAGDRTRASLRHAIGSARAQLRRTAVFALVTTIALVVVIAVTGLAAAASWGALGAGLSNGDVSIGTTLLLVGFVALFSGGLVLIALVSAWRGAIWTIEMGGTFGGGAATRSGD
jgi:hypothetical protein